MELERFMAATADYGFPMLVSAYLLLRMEGKMDKLNANIEALTKVLADKLVLQFPYIQQQ